MFETSKDFGFVLFHFLKSTDKAQVYVTATVYKTLCNVHLCSESCRGYFKMERFLRIHFQIDQEGQQLQL